MGSQARDIVVLGFCSKRSCGTLAAPGAFDIMEVSNFLLENIRSGGNIGALQGWDREPKKLWPTLQRTALEDAWGFSLVGGLDYLEAAGRYSGIVTQRGDVGLWLKVKPVRPGTPAEAAGLKASDFINRLNGQIVFHLDPKDVERLINTSGFSLLLDIERNSPKAMIYDNGLHQIAMNYLFNDFPIYRRQLK